MFQLFISDKIYFVNNERKEKKLKLKANDNDNIPQTNIAERITGILVLMSIKLRSRS